MALVQIEGYQYVLQDDSIPSVCPRCHQGVHAVMQGCSTKNKTGSFEIACHCPSCKGIFTSFWKSDGQRQLTLNKVEPQYPRRTSFPLISKLSPSFETIYNQALSAEAYGLNEIAGIGFRKALEFLIKDYCTHKNPEQLESIRRKALGAVIGEDLEAGRIKEAAKRTVWLGNDETHYVSKWEDKDIADLRNLLRLT